jgi:hypothetical protein
MVLSRLMSALGPTGDAQEQPIRVKELPLSPTSELLVYNDLRVFFDSKRTLMKNQNPIFQRIKSVHLAVRSKNIRRNKKP